ncbi:MAG: hypothetical protein LC794_12950 [Acidobacteria bacterium]|nr:hypothetical protein [Acidobacteriota bacterium]MCA1627579.1 hypothetical protein [Acidobacteriota bacterium]
MSDPFAFFEPENDDDIPPEWEKNPPWQADPDLADLKRIMRPRELDYWNEGGQPHSERQRFLAKIDARWRRWKAIARERHRKGQPHRQELQSEVERATKVMGEAAKILRGKSKNVPVQTEPDPSPQPHGRGIFTIANVGATIVIGIATQKWGAEVPDWLFVLLCLIPVALWFIWLWTHPAIKKHRWLVYTYPRMSFTVMILVGMLTGGLVSSLLWWTAQRRPQQAASNPAEPAPVTPTVLFPQPSGEFEPAVPNPSPAPYFSVFMNRFAPLHEGFKTYQIASPAGLGMCSFYVRLGQMPLTNKAHMVIYVPQLYCVSAIIVSVVNNHEGIVQELKDAVKRDGPPLLDLKVEPFLVVFSDDVSLVGPPDTRKAWEAARQKGLAFTIETPKSGPTG